MTKDFFVKLGKNIKSVLLAIILIALLGFAIYHSVIPAHSASSNDNAIDYLGDIGSAAAGKIIELTLWPGKKAAEFVTDKVTQSMSDEMVRGLGNTASVGIEDLGQRLVLGLVSGFGPDITTFLRVLAGDDISNTSGGYSATWEGATSFKNIAIAFGVAISTIVLVFSLVLFFISEPGSIKDTPWRLVLRYAIALFLIVNSLEVMSVFMSIANDIWRNYIVTVNISSGDSQTLSFDDFNAMPGSVTEENEEAMKDSSNGESTKDLITGTLLGIPLAGSTLVRLWPLVSVFTIISLIISWPMIKGFIKFYIEIIERYLVVVLLYLFFPAAAGTIVSKNTSNIMGAYMKMLASQIFILFANVAFMGAFVHVLIAGGWLKSIPNYIFCLAYLRVCQRLDSYMASLGLNVAQTGNSLFDTIAGTGRNLLSMVGNARRTGSEVGSKLAASAGSPKMAAAFKAAGGLRGAADVVAAGSLTKAGLSLSRDTGQKMRVGATEAADIMRDSLRSPSNSVYRNQVEGMNSVSQVNGMNKMLDQQKAMPGLSVDSVDTSRLNRGELGFTAKSTDPSSNLAVKGTLSSRETPGSVSIGDGLYLSTQNQIPDAADIMNGDIKYGDVRNGDIRNGDIRNGNIRNGDIKNGDIKNGDTIHHGGNQSNHIGNTITHGTAQTLGYVSGTSNVINGMKASNDPVMRSAYTGMAGMSYDKASGNFSVYDKNDRQMGTISSINGDMAYTPSMSKLSSNDASDPGSKSSSPVPDNSGLRSALNLDSAARKVEQDNNYVPGSLSLNDTQSNAKAPLGTLYGTAMKLDDFTGEAKPVNVRVQDVGVHGSKGNGVISTLDQSAHRVMVQDRPIRKVETETSKGGKDPTRSTSAPKSGNPKNNGPKNGGPKNNQK